MDRTILNRPGSVHAGNAPVDRNGNTRLTDYQDSIEALVHRVRAVDIRPYEILPADKLWRELVPLAEEFLQDALVLTGAVLQTCEHLGVHATVSSTSSNDDYAAHTRFERDIDAAIQKGLGDIQAVEDIVFLVQLELRQRCERLAGLSETSQIPVLVGQCDSALRRICKGMGALDLAISKAESVPTQLDFTSELQDSLRVRAAYAKFRAGILKSQTKSESKLYPGLRAAGTSIAILVGWDAYPLLRVYDRLQLRDLQGRILSWLRPETREDEVSGVIILEEVASFAELLRQVNNRQELIEHDRQLIGASLEQIRNCKIVIDEHCVEHLQALVGLDDDLDRVLATKPPHVVVEWQPVLERLALRLGATQGTSS